MVNKENIRKWVDALRSGEYEQKSGSLRQYDKFCCLGVACEVAIASGEPIKTEKDNNGLVSYDAKSCLLPTRVITWLGVESPDPAVKNDVENRWEYLTWLNDCGYTFDFIADCIELTFLEEEKENG